MSYYIRTFSKLLQIFLGYETHFLYMLEGYYTFLHPYVTFHSDIEPNWRLVGEDFCAV
jgi:hypothetical protein